MAQEAVRPDELVDSFTVFKSTALVNGDAAAHPSWVVDVPIPARPISRIHCDLSLHITEIETGAYATVTNTGVAPAGLYCRELSSIVGQVAAMGVYSEYVFTSTHDHTPDDGKRYEVVTEEDLRVHASACQPTPVTTWLRPLRDIRQMTLDVVDVSTSMVPMTLNAPGSADGGVSLRMIARFTFFGPRDTRMYM